MKPKRPKGMVILPLGLGFIAGSGLSSEEVGEARQFVIAQSPDGEISIYGPYSGFDQNSIDEKVDSLFERGEEPEIFEADTEDEQESLKLWEITTK